MSMIAPNQTTAQLEASLIATAAERDRYREALEVYAAMNYPFNEVAKQALGLE